MLMVKLTPILNPNPSLILANCPYLIGTVPNFTQEKVGKRNYFAMCPYFCKNLSVVMYRKFRNVPIFKDFPSICPYFLGFRVGKYVILILTLPQTITFTLTLYWTLEILSSQEQLSPEQKSDHHSFLLLLFFSRVWRAMLWPCLRWASSRMNLSTASSQNSWQSECWIFPMNLKFIS